MQIWNPSPDHCPTTAQSYQLFFTQTDCFCGHRHELWKPIIRSVFMTVCSNWASEWSVNQTDSLLQQFRFWLVWHVLSGQPALRHSCPDNYLHVSLLELMSYWIAEQNSLLDIIKYFYKVKNDLWNIYIYIYIWVIPTTIFFPLAKLINISGCWVFEGLLLIYCSVQITVDFKIRREMEKARELSDAVPYFSKSVKSRSGGRGENLQTNRL